MKRLLVFFLVLSFAITGYAQETEEESASSVGALTATVSTSPGDLRAEAKQLDIPQSQVKRYVVKMRGINKDYQSGALTRTEYISIKRNVIQRLK